MLVTGMPSIQVPDRPQSTHDQSRAAGFYIVRYPFGAKVWIPRRHTRRVFISYNTQANDQATIQTVDSQLLVSSGSYHLGQPKTKRVGGCRRTNQGLKERGIIPARFPHTYNSKMISIT